MQCLIVVGGLNFLLGAVSKKFDPKLICNLPSLAGGRIFCTALKAAEGEALPCTLVSVLVVQISLADSSVHI